MEIRIIKKIRKKIRLFRIKEKCKNNGIVITSFSIKPGHIRFIAYTLDKKIQKWEKYFNYEDDFIPHNDIIAYIIALFCYQAYNKIHFNLPISHKAIDEIQQFTKAKITVNKISNDAYEVDSNYNKKALLFSGGIDSLATKKLLDKDTHLLSIKWEGKVAFEKEYMGFIDYNKNIVSTNMIVGDVFKNRGVAFMAFPALLYQNKCKIKKVCFGSIADAGNSWWNKESYNNTLKLPFYNILALDRMHYVLGISGIGTQMITSYYYNKNEITKSIESVAPEGNAKQTEKRLYNNIIYDKFNIGVPNMEIIYPNRKYIWGEELFADIRAIYLIKNIGITEVSKLFDNLPKDIVSFTNDLTLHYMESAILSLYNGDDKKSYIKKINNAGVSIWDENDYDEYEKVISYLEKYHFFDNKLDRDWVLSV